MTPEDFRHIALSMPEAVEVHRRDHLEFRVERRTFASLEAPANAMAIVNLTPEQQAMFMHAAPKAFVPAAGGGLAAPMFCLHRLPKQSCKVR